MNWRHRTWWYKMIPYFVLIFWMSATTYFVVYNTQAINKGNDNQTEAVCFSDNQIRSLISTVIADDAKESTGAAQQYWIQVYHTLNPELKQQNCNDPKILFKIEQTDEGKGVKQ